MRRKLTYNPARDYYAILGIETTATNEEVRQAYRRCVWTYHPDRNPDRVDWATDQVQLVNEAYGILRQTHLRREYDRLRWPHIPHQPRPRQASHTTTAPAPDPARPWWEQAAPYASPRRAAHARSGARAAAQAANPPAWMAISAWMREHRLGALESPWLTLVGMWRSPYAGLLIILAVLLALNVAGIVYAFINPGGLEQVANILAAPTATPADLVAAPGAAPDRLRQLCLDPGIQIRTPVNYEPVDDMFSVFGTAQHAEMWSYVVELGYLGQTVEPDALPTEWRIVRAPPDGQSLPAPPVVDDMLAEGIDMTNRPEGFYAVRLRLILSGGEVVPPCDVIIRR